MGAHLTYPHANGFHGDRLGLARYEPGVGATGLVSVRWQDGGLDERPVATITPRRDGEVRPAYFDSTEPGSRAVAVAAVPLTGQPVTGR